MYDVSSVLKSLSDRCLSGQNDLKIDFYYSISIDDKVMTLRFSMVAALRYREYCSG